VSRVVPEIIWSGSAFLIGLTGVIGSGKSTVAKLFAKHGATVLDADRLAKDALVNPSLQIELLARFPGAFENGALQTARLAEIVFPDPQKLKQLTDLTYPIVRQSFQETVRGLTPGAILVYDVPLLFEANLQDDFDLTVCVKTADPVRLERLRKRGLTDSDIKRREELQLSSTEKERRADMVLLNNGQADELEPAVVGLLEEIRSRRAP